ncbi:M23 family metallopeptidase [Candidatus Parcubacteria bacterium]|nr:M23 family metallopeptidase [Candidatus Parcubacteria bacterium]
MSNNFFRLIGLILSLIILFGAVFLYFGSDVNNSVSLISDKISNEGFFVDSRKTPRLESPNLYLIEKNSLMASCPVMTVDPQVLGSFLAGESDSENRKEIVEYVVESGDTLSSIAEKFNISLNTVLWVNDLDKNSKIKPGQKLIILPVSGVLHLVKSGDTLSEIAEIYKAKTGEIADLNRLSENKEIFIGDLLIIPDGKMPSKKTYYTNIPLTDSYFILPTQGLVTQGIHWYNAIDVANKCGTPILAAAGGIVQRIGYKNWPAGNYVRILHPNGVVTLYGHLSKILVKQGKKVSQGQVIGYMGRTGLATGCHLHFDVRGAKNPLAKYPLGSEISWK